MQGRLSLVSLAKEGNTVIPLDQVRTIEYTSLEVLSGGLVGSGMKYHIIGSGKEAYIREIWITELSGIGSELNIYDSQSGTRRVLPPIKVLANQDVVIKDICVGPIQSGLVVGSSGEKIAASVTLVVQVDPHAPIDMGPA